MTSEDSKPEGPELRALRMAAGLSLREFAAYSTFSASFLSRVENGRRSATSEIVNLYQNISTVADRQRSARCVARPAQSRSDAGTSAPDAIGIVWYGAEVRRRRMAEGKSLNALGLQAYLSRAYLGKIEQGHARGTYQIALSLDSALDAGGKLAQLFLDECARVGPVPPDPAALARTPGRDGFFAASDPAELVAEATEQLGRLQILSHQAGPHSVVHALGEGVIHLHGRAAECSARSAAAARPIWFIALRYAEFLGWTAQETGHDGRALRWTRAAADWARRIGDADALAYTWIRQSQWARRTGDPDAARGYAHAAGDIPGISSRIKLFAAQREAQAWALTRDERSFRHALDRYHMLIGRGLPDDEPTPDPPWGPLPDPHYENSRILEATCLVDLGDFDGAATLFAEQMSRFRSGRTGYARSAVREAIAYAHSGSPELACEVALQSLPVLARQGSASLRGDLDRLSRILNRHRAKAVVRDLLPDLAVLARAAGAVPTGAEGAHRTPVA
jgi:transcriptional regulator with XRE-family HTH domain